MRREYTWSKQILLSDDDIELGPQMAGTGSANAKGKGKGNAKGKKGKGKEKKNGNGNGQGSAGNQQHVRDGPVAPARAREEAKRERS
jgi:hypothetical protein